MRLNKRAVLRPMCWVGSHNIGFISIPRLETKDDGSAYVSRRVEFGCRRCLKVLDIDDYHRDEVLAAMETRKMREERYREYMRDK